MDKFDFTLEWINMLEQVSELSKEELDFIFKENTKNTIGIAIQSILLECKSTGKVSVEGLTCKESAINIMLSWFCSRGCKHHISLDIGVSLNSKESVLEYLGKSGISLIGTSFEGVIKAEESIFESFNFVPYLEKNYTYHRRKVDTSYHDQAIFVCSINQYPVRIKKSLDFFIFY